MKTLLRSFAGGEITPELYGRIDLTKYQTGVALARNFLALPHGPMDRRPGFEFINEAKDSTQTVRLIPFAFSADQTVVLEFGDEYVRFHIDGETLLEADKTIVSVAANTVEVTSHGYSTGDWVFIANRFFKVTSTGANTFTTTDLGGLVALPDAAATACARVYTLATPYTEDTLFDLNFAQDSDILTITSQAYAARELARVSAASWTLTVIDFSPTGAIPTGASATPTSPAGGPNTPYSYVITSIGADNITESLPSSVVVASNNLTLAGNYNTVAWSAVAGATRYRVYKQRGGAFGYIGSTTLTSIVDDNVLADTSITPPEDIYTLNESSGEYPAAVTYYEQRRWFAGTAEQPQHIWATRNATQSNLTSSIPSQADDALNFRIAAQQQNAIRHLVPLADVIALTVGGEFRIYADSAPSITPESLSIKPQGYMGASNVQPALTSNSILYVQAQGSRIRELAYNWQNASYVSIDITIMAPHLFDGYTAVDMAYSRAPLPTLWVVRSDGKLLSMTYVPEQQVYAWAQHDTDGLFKSVCVVSEGNEDALYAVVLRTVNGRSCRYIERLKTRFFVDQEDAFFVDSGLSYSGAATDTVTGLWHLEGEEVQILADGAVLPTDTVVNGQLTLDGDYSDVHVGLAYTSDLQTLPLGLTQVDAGGQYLQKNVSGVALRVSRSSLVSAGPTFARLSEYPARAVTDDYGAPPALRTGELSTRISGSWGTDGAVCVRQDQPLPLTVLSIALEVATGS